MSWTKSDSTLDHDVVILGAGISGICFAHRLQERNPELTYCILEQRSEIGGTWSLFKYPGIRSDSDLHTFGFPWRPWTEPEPIAQGESIRRYMVNTLKDEGIDRKILFERRVQRMDWDSSSKSWAIHSRHREASAETLKCRFVLLATGYFDYEQPLAAIIPGIDSFAGQVVHPQFWPVDLEYADKNVVVIGSGATAITLLPNLAKKAKHTIMLQRSPSYVMAVAGEDSFDRFARRWMPSWIASKLIRLKWIVVPTAFRAYCLAFPAASRRMVMNLTQAQLGKEHCLKPNFSPTYQPFEQRMCMSPSGDFFECLREGRGSVVTGRIKQVTKRSIELESGEELHPDVIVTATGLKLRLGGGIDISVDGTPYAIPDHHAWKGLMLDGLPNVAFSFGYFDASWTLGVDTSAQLACRLLKQMHKDGTKAIVPTRSDVDRQHMRDISFMPLSSTYVQKGLRSLPKSGDRKQWRPRSTYLLEFFSVRWGDIHSGLAWVR